MVVEIITIGTEILIGSIINTNSNYLSKELANLGLETHYHTTVNDDRIKIKEVINIALSRADIIITTGGLGPTDDDLTKEVVAEALGVRLEKDTDAEFNLVNRFKSTNSKMTKNNLKQTFKPAGSKLILNDRGTAPGIYMENDNSKIIMLPGPPREMNYMFEKYVIDLLKGDYNIVTKSINSFGIGESSLEEELKTLDIYEEGFEIATFAQLGTCEIKIIGKGFDIEKINSKIEEKTKIIEEKLGEYIYGYDNKPLEEVLITNLKKKDYTISTCESCTGGLVASKLTKVAGASNVFDLGLITYSNKTKVEELKVSEDVLNSFGAVSKETAYEMAQGLYRKTKANVVLSITGIAGPGGSSDSKPVGLVHFCIMINGRETFIREIFPGDRISIQERAANTALSEINKLIK